MEAFNMQEFLGRSAAYIFLVIAFMYGVWGIFFPTEEKKQKQQFPYLPPLDEEFYYPPAPVGVIRRRYRDREYPIIDAKILSEVARPERKQTQMLFHRPEPRFPVVVRPKKEKKQAASKTIPPDDPPNTDEVALVQVETKVETPVCNPTTFFEEEIREAGGANDIHADLVKEEQSANTLALRGLRRSVEPVAKPGYRHYWSDILNDWVEVVEGAPYYGVPKIEPLIKPVDKVNAVLKQIGEPAVRTVSGVELTPQQLRERLDAMPDSPAEYRKHSSGS
jgi:hypothetical protein